MSTSQVFDFSARWPSGSEDVAEISLRLGTAVISRIRDSESGQERDFFRASSTSVALWLADNWWRLRWETYPYVKSASHLNVDWRLRHELNSAGGGAMWPPVMIYSVGERIAFAPSTARRLTAGPQSYLPFKINMVAADAYESELDDFFQAVIDHCAGKTDGNALKLLVAQISEERNDIELAAWRRLEACLGFDADEAPDQVINALIEFENIAGEDGVEEAAHAKPGSGAADCLGIVIDATRTSGLQVDLGLAADVEASLDRESFLTPWEMAMQAADNLRSILNIDENKPFENECLADIFRTRWESLKSATATARELPYGARISDEHRACISLQSSQVIDRRFELARQFGDAIWQSNSQFGIVSRSKTDRQKFQRAFANNLLCPVMALNELVDSPGDKSARESAGRALNVRSAVVHNQLVYSGRLPFKTIAERAEVS